MYNICIIRIMKGVRILFVSVMEMKWRYYNVNFSIFMKSPVIYNEENHLLARGI